MPKGFPGPGIGFPKLQEQDGSAGNPDSEDIYESIDESLFEEYESSYIYRVESVPNRPANTCKCTSNATHTSKSVAVVQPAHFSHARLEGILLGF